MTPGFRWMWTRRGCVEFQRKTLPTHEAHTWIVAAKSRAKREAVHFDVGGEYGITTPQETVTAS